MEIQKKQVAQEDSLWRAVLAMVSCAFLFSLMILLTKSISPRVPSTESLFVRSFVNAVALFVIMRGRGVLVLGRSHRQLLLRGVCGFLSAAAIFYGAAHTSVAGATALFRSSALFMPFVAMAIAGERFRFLRFIYAGVGFVGVAMILHLGGTSLDFGGLVALCGGFFTAVSFATVRNLTKIEHPFTIVFYFVAISSVLAPLVFGRSFVVPDSHELITLTLISLCGLLGQYCLTISYTYAEATVITPFGYFEVAFSAILGWIFLGETLSTSAIAGVVIMVWAAIKVSSTR